MPKFSRLEFCPYLTVCDTCRMSLLPMIQSTTMSATPDNELSTWLLNLNLRAFEVALVAIGVETVGDLR